MIRRHVLAWVVLAVVLAFGAAAYLFVSSRGVRVAVVNQGPGTLHDAVVHVTGQSYRLEDVAVGAQATVRVEPSGESHVEVAFTDPEGASHRLGVDTYFEADGYHGTIVVEIRSNVIERVDDQVDIGIF